MLESFAPDVWFFEHDLWIPGRIHFRGRTTVVRLADGGLWVHSPNPIDDELAAQLDGLGPVRHLVAPNKVHHVHLSEVRARYPDSILWGAPGLAEKRPDLSFDETLSSVAPDAWSETFDQVFVDGVPWINEVVFMHRPSKTLIVTDLVFNIHSCKGLMTRPVLRIVGAWRRLAQSRLFKSQVKDPAVFGEAGRTMMAWDFDKVLMAHGIPLQGPDAQGRGPHAQMAEALAWMTSNR